MTSLSEPQALHSARLNSQAPSSAEMNLMTSFSDLGLVEPLQRAVRDEKYTHPTPIQAQAIPHLLEGRDLLGCARTGTGKTAAFALPILQRLSASHPGASGRAPGRSARALVLVPTRELAAQVGESFQTYGRCLHLSVAVVYGGVNQNPQVRALARGVDILVATPGRLLDLMGQGHIRLDRLEVLVLDESDQMLDLGFIPDVRKILRTVPKQRQTLLFSATMPPAIAALADGILTKPVKVMVTPAASTVDEVDQRVYFVDRSGKPALLAKVLSDPAVQRALVFTRTKRGADRVARGLVQGGIPAEAIHGNKSQGTRERTLLGFRRGRTRVLVATDIAARGIDIDDITHVINFELPNVPESYVHRIGRTARAGASGVAISLCDGEERAFLRDIERLIRREVKVVGGSKETRSTREWESRGQDHAAHGPRAHSHRAQGRGPAAGGHHPHARGRGISAGARHHEARGKDAHARTPRSGHGAHLPRPVLPHGGRKTSHGHPGAGGSSGFGEGLAG
jgi:ATP-dependent RNA helicase RhlE